MYKEIKNLIISYEKLLENIDKNFKLAKGELNREKYIHELKELNRDSIKVRKMLIDYILRDKFIHYIGNGFFGVKHNNILYITDDNIFLRIPLNDIQEAK